jgi:hypothetical protein
MKLLISFLFTVNAFAAFTPFAPSNPPADSITAKGNLLTSDGTGLAEKAACANGEIIEWDSTVTEGFKCVTKPVDTNAGTLCAAGEYLDGDGTCKTVPSGGGPSVIGAWTAPALNSSSSQYATATLVTNLTLNAGSYALYSNRVGSNCSASIQNSDSSGVAQLSALVRGTGVFEADHRLIYVTGLSGTTPIIYGDNPSVVYFKISSTVTISSLVIRYSRGLSSGDTIITGACTWELVKLI